MIAVKKTVLITNDDGIGTRGLEALIAAFRQCYTVWIIAPSQEQSGKSHSFTYLADLGYRQHERDDGLLCYSVDGTPADCVMVAFSHLLPYYPDYVISGINKGDNLGVATFYSGTVAAAREAGFRRIPSCAFSVNYKSGEWVEEYAPLALEIFQRMERETFFDNWQSYFYNVNFPAGVVADISGLRVVRQSMAFYNDTYVSQTNTAGESVLTFAAEGSMDEIETDAHCFDIAASRAGYITVTPILLDATADQALASMKKIENMRFDDKGAAQ